MARQVRPKGTNNFIGGLVTETTALKFPENACTETFNCVFDETGRVSRRLGFDLEVDYQLRNVIGVNPTVSSQDVFTEHVWTSVGGDGNKTFLVQQHGSKLYFYDVSQSTEVSDNDSGLVINLLNHIPTGGSPASNQCQFATGVGALIVTNPACQPFVVEYDADSGTLTDTNIEVKVRDFAGLEETLYGLDERPNVSVATLKANNPEHYYNLINQGWYVPTALDDWDTARGDLPSNCDTVALCRASETDAFDGTRVAANSPGNTPAPRGHFIMATWDLDREAALSIEGFTGVSIDPEEAAERPSCTEFFAGRAWFAGINAPKLNGNIYFSQILTKIEDAGRCHQKNDPTSEHLSDLLPDDGGVIRIPEMATVKRLFAYQNSLLVFATNGVWQISGSANGAFLATDYVVRKLSSGSTQSPLSFTSYKGVPVWWGEDGINTVKFDPNYGSFAVESITDTKIKSFILSIPEFNRRFVKGVYDVFNDTLYFLYNSDEELAATDHYIYNAVLVLNGLSGAFYPWAIGDSTPAIRGVAYIVPADGLSSPKVKYTTTTAFNLITYSECRVTSYKDWSFYAFEVGDSSLQADYTSYFITGYSLDGGAQRYFQPNYVWVYLEHENFSSCYMQGVFDFTTDGNSGKWSTRQQVYNPFLEHRSVNHRRLKIRGKGKALQLRFQSETGKPFNIVGWSIWETINSGV